ncbi:Acyl-CoA synthetase (AMP-forming)/AMP-acid ligase II [Noviherbaspirillum humi]|uniref:Acyl-CoA synthetase (AMP-forming)/AMP-acid ligase II n=1 Tax=Noviherbaspirillum humi TaxID=1688639 RepID=A0A239HFL0_9BURK|nr:class I adenylate-forming enzyme family protein [Noviherbaspirillum humi]SNS79064.1 Acyl-CoA synthetase (AMP-forming)/AMP-acid ligase II [Noviherbaspirillum humi]
MQDQSPRLDDLLDRDFLPLPELIRFHATIDGRHTALIQDEKRLDYAALDALMDRIAASLQRDGLGSGDAIAICGLNSIPYAAVFLGALRAGVAVAPLAPSSSPESLAGMLKDASARLLFADAATRSALAAAGVEPGIPVVAIDGSGNLPFERWLAAEGAKPAPVDISPDQAFNIIYSSGTTGAPKGIVQPFSMRWTHVQRGRINGYGADAVTLISTPLYSNTTLVSFFPTIGLGGTLVLMAKFDAGAYLQLAQRHRVTHTMLVPVQYQRIMDRPDFADHDLSAFRMKFCTSAPFSAALKADILRRWPGGLIEYYGMTEGGGTCVLAAHEHPHKLHTVGLPAPGHDIRLIDDAGREVGPGEAGEVVGHSPAMMKGYHNQPEKSAEAEWHDPSGKRFIRTGDVGRFDADGFLILLDRKKDMIISGGFNIYPSDLEAVLRQHPAVHEAAVVGVPSVRWGETPVAFVVAREDATDGADAIRDWANARLGKTQRLADLVLTDSLPRSPIGKVLKRELRDAYVPRGPI